MQDVQLLEPRFVLAAPNPMDLLNALNIFGLRFDGQAAQDATGFSVSGCGDLNGDGYDDFATSARNADPGGDTNAGETYVVFGWFSGGPYPASALNINGANGFRIPGIDTDDFSGWSVSGAGDINGDGLGDLIIGAHFADPAGVDRAGEVYVVFGKGDVFPVELNPATMTAAQGFRIDGADADDQAGLSVSGAGDFNADGYNDLIGILKGKPEPSVLAPSKSTFATGLINLIDYLPDAMKRYSYTFDGSAQTLDHILVSQEFYDNSRKRIWLFEGMAVNNDHLNFDNHKADGTNDHGIIRAVFKYKPIKVQT